MSGAELVLRISAVLILAFVAILWLRDARKRLTGVLVAVFMFGVISYLLCPPLDRHWQFGILEVPFFIGCYGAALFFYLMSRAIFDDGFRLQTWHLLLLAILEGLGAWHRFGLAVITDIVLPFHSEQLPLVLHQLLSLGITITALVLALLGRSNDLVEPRRRFRDIFVAVSGAYILVVLTTEIVLRSRPAVPELELLNIAAILFFTLVFALVMTQLRPTLQPMLGPAPSTTVKSSLTPADKELLDAIENQMELQRAYRQEGLTIAKLAATLGTQEYLLRRLINGSLGFRNFNEFLNSYRIKEVCARLENPENRHLPILTLAMESGFSSLGPFNRAFKDVTGTTPTAYRENHTVSKSPKN